MAQRQQQAIAFFNYAHSYAVSASALDKCKLRVTHGDGPVGFLYFHAIELYLKSFLIMRDYPESELKKPKYGHNTTCLGEETKKHGLLLTKTDQLVLDHMATSGNVLASRYIVLGLSTRLSPEVYPATCYRLHTQIGPVVYSGIGRIPVLEPAFGQQD